MPRIYTLIQDTTHSPTILRGAFHRASPAGGTAQHFGAGRRIKGVTHFTEEKLFCSGVTGKQLEQRAPQSSQADRGKGNRNFSFVKTERIIFTVWEQRKRFTLRHFSQQLFKVSHLEPQAMG